LSKNGLPATGQDSLYASATIDKNANELIIKVINTLNKTQVITIQLDGSKKIESKARLLVLKNGDLEAVNSLDNPSVVAPVEQVVELKGKIMPLTLAPYSFSILKIKMK
jgi:alpha-L-arabinofuranosidase